MGIHLIEKQNLMIFTARQCTKRPASPDNFKQNMYSLKNICIKPGIKKEVIYMNMWNS